MKGAPLPWFQIDGSRLVWDAEGKIVCDPRTREIGEFIVRAANADRETSDYPHNDGPDYPPGQ